MSSFGGTRAGVLGAEYLPPPHVLHDVPARPGLCGRPVHFTVSGNSVGHVRQEELCISPGRMVRVLFVDLVCLDHSGNIMDASVSALETVTLPSVTMDTDTGEVVVSDKRRTKLKLDSSPVSTTFAVFNSTTTTTTSPPPVSSSPAWWRPAQPSATTAGFPAGHS